MGLSPQTVGKIIKVIRSSGQLQDMKQNMRSMNAVAYRRLNHALDIVAKDKTRKGKNEEEHGTGKPQKGEEGQVENKKVARKKAVNESFINYLLNELQMDSEAIRTDPEAKRDAIKLTRANDAQAVSLEKRMGREKVQKDRRMIADEQDPKKKQQLRQISQREKQLQALKDEARGTDPNQPTGKATM